MSTKKNKITFEDITNYVKDNFPEKNEKEIYDFIYEAVIAQKDFIDGLNTIRETLEKIGTQNVTENQTEQITTPIAPLLPSLGDGYNFFPAPDGRLILNKGDC